MAYKELSKFMSDDGKREATVYQCVGIDGHGYRVTVKSDSGSMFSSEFESIDRAEEYAEDWVL